MDIYVESTWYLSRAFVEENHIFIEDSGFLARIYKGSVDVFDDISVGFLYLR